MRPRKIVLVVDENEQSGAVLKFLLETRGYRVILQANCQDAARLLDGSAEPQIEAVVVRQPARKGLELLEFVKKRDLLTGTLLLGDSVERLIDPHVDVFLTKGGQSPVEILERLRLLVARKRGPRPAVFAQL